MSAPPESRSSSSTGSHDSPDAHSGVRIPSDAELAEMSTEDLVRLGNRMDDIEVVSDRARFPVPGTRAERRAERQVAGWFVISALSGLAFLAVFIFWPWEYVPAGEEGSLAYALYTPIIGFTLGLSIVAVGMGVIAYSKKLLPEDLTIQQRHDGPSKEIERRTAAARLVQTGATSGLGRRKLIVRSIGASVGVLGAGLAVAAFGGLVKNPWKEGADSALLTTEWKSDGERVYLRKNNGVSEDVVLVRAGDLPAGSMETVYPFRESDRSDPDKLKEVLTSADSPVMLIRLRNNVAVIKRAGQEDFNYGSLFAYSKICTHMGCPTSLYEDQTMRILCPCHQSQFVANEYAKPIFGPATRPLAQLPIAVDDQGYLYARSDFIEPVGPAFWERRS